MTLEQKLEYVRGLKNDELLHQYAIMKERAMNVFDWVNKGYEFSEIMEAEEIYRNECLRRMGN